jgi:hypothetical protein
MRTITAIVVLASLGASSLMAQSDAERAAVMAPVHRLFDAMRAGDSAMARTVFHEEARLLGLVEREGQTTVRASSIDGFLAAIGRPHDQVWDEKIWDWEVRIDDNLATVWTWYAFYLGDTFSHCGIDSFQLLRIEGEWNVVSLADTRRRSGCEAPAHAR